MATSHSTTPFKLLMMELDFWPASFFSTLLGTGHRKCHHEDGLRYFLHAAM